jgi:hypothetical protein
MAKIKVTTAVAKKSAKPAGRPRGTTVLIDDIKREELINLIVLGMPVNKAVAMVNVSESSFYNWMSRGMVERDRLATIVDAKNKPEEKIYLDFLESLTRARAEAIAKKVAVISSAASQGDWKASAWWLERQVPEDFGRVDKQEVLSHSVSEVRVTVTMGELQEKIAKVLESRKTKSA